jgi:hypothetical protein
VQQVLSGLSESGKRTYSITARRITSCEVLMVWMPPPAASPWQGEALYRHHLKEDL